MKEDEFFSAKSIGEDQEKKVWITEVSNKSPSANNNRESRYISSDYNELISAISKNIIISEPAIQKFCSLVDVKITNTLRSNWKRYYLVIEHNIFKLYKHMTKYQPSISINFDLVTCKISVISNRVLEISPLGISKSLLIKTTKHDQTEDLCLSVYFNIVRSIGYNIELSNLWENSRKLWKKFYISYSQFFEICEHGDIMLFKTPSIGSAAVRMVSNSEYDHVGLLLRGDLHEIFLYECLGSGGVQMNSINFFLDNKWEQLYKKIVIRKLHFKRDKEFIKKLTFFCYKWLGRPYKLTAKKLFKRHSVAETEHNNFFCSELVAAIYKKIGLLPVEKSSCRYWPSDFSAKNKLSLNNGAYLGEEMRIIFCQ